MSYQDFLNTVFPEINNTEPHVTNRYGAPRSYGGHAGTDSNYVGGQVSPINQSHPPIHSPIAGEVVSTDANWGLVKIRDAEGNTHDFRHMHETSVNVGDQISVGEELGTMGGRGRRNSSQPYTDRAYDQHLHYEVRDARGVRHNPEEFWRDRQPAVEQNTTTIPNVHYNGSQLELVAPQSSVTPSSTPASNTDYKTEVLTKTTVAVNDLCDARGYPNHGGRDNMSCYLANDLIAQGAQGKGKFEAALHTDGKTISVREQISEFKDFIASADSNVIVNIPKAESLAKIAAYESPVLTQNSPTHEQEISRGRSL